MTKEYSSSYFIETECFSAQNRYRHQNYVLLIKAIRSKLVEENRARDQNQIKPNPDTIKNTLDLLFQLDSTILNQLEFDDISTELNGSISVDIFFRDLSIYFSIGDSSFNYFVKHQGEIIAEKENISFSQGDFSQTVAAISDFLKYTFDHNINAYFHKVLSRRNTSPSYRFLCPEPNFEIV